MSSYWGTEGHNIRVVTEELRYRKKRVVTKELMKN